MTPRPNLKEHNISSILAQFVDLHGVAKAKAVPVEHFEMILGDGTGFAGFALWGYGMGPDGPDLMEKGDLNTLRVIPWLNGSERSRRNIGAEPDREANRAVVVARQVRDGQIEQAARVEALTLRAIGDLERKAAQGDLSVCDLATLVKLREKHRAHVKDMAGLNLAEKIAIAKVKDDAAGRGFAGALLDATSIDLGDGVFDVVTDD